jgi:hypothetical protein
MLAGGRRDPASLQGWPGICRWLSGAGLIVPDGGSIRCSSIDPGRRNGRCRTRRHIPDPGTLSGVSQLVAGQPCLPEGGTRQRRPIMAGYERLIGWFPDGFRLSQAPIADTVGAFPFLPPGGQ